MQLGPFSHPGEQKLMRQQSKAFSPRAFHYACAIARRGRVSPLLAITAVTLSLSAVMGAVLADLMFS